MRHEPRPPPVSIRTRARLAERRRPKPAPTVLRARAASTLVPPAAGLLRRLRAPAAIAHGCVPCSAPLPSPREPPPGSLVPKYALACRTLPRFAIDAWPGPRPHATAAHAPGAAGRPEPVTTASRFRSGRDPRLCPPRGCRGSATPRPRPKRRSAAGFPTGPSVRTATGSAAPRWRALHDGPKPAGRSPCGAAPRPGRSPRTAATPRQGPPPSAGAGDGGAPPGRALRSRRWPPQAASRSRALDHPGRSRDDRCCGPPGAST